MKEIKSVRVRRKFTSNEENLSGFSDYKVTLYDNGRNTFKVGVVQSGRMESFAEYRREGKFENFSNNDFINDGINVLISKQNDNKEFEIIQDPWLETPPKWRSFGSTPYYLNNGAEVIIRWLDGTTSAGGRKWSDDNGNELKVSRNGDTKSSIEKIVEIIAPDSYQGQRFMKLTDDGIKSKSDENRDLIFKGSVSDKDILNLVISKWNIKVPNYILSLCDPDYIKCEIIPYISPVDELVDIDKKLETSDETKPVKEKLTVVLPKDAQTKARSDISFKIFVGELPKTEKPTTDGFDFGDEEDLSDLLLEDQFKEADFPGLDESQLEIQEYPDERTRVETEKQAEVINNQPYIPGKYTLDLIPGNFLGNSKQVITCCNIDGKPINIKIADAVLDMKAAAKKDGINLVVSSGFRPGFNPSINTKSKSGVKITAQSQEELYEQNCVGRAKCSPDTAPAGRSKHGNGIAVDFNTGSRGGDIKNPLNENLYSWLVKNSWRFGFIRTVASEEWHFEYWKEASKSGPYAKLPKSNKVFYADLGLNNLKIT